MVNVLYKYTLTIYFDIIDARVCHKGMICFVCYSYIIVPNWCKVQDSMYKRSSSPFLSGHSPRFASIDVNMDGTIQYEEFLVSRWQGVTGGFKKCATWYGIIAPNRKTFRNRNMERLRDTSWALRTKSVALSCKSKICIMTSFLLPKV